MTIGIVFYIYIMKEFIPRKCYFTIVLDFSKSLIVMYCPLEYCTKHYIIADVTLITIGYCIKASLFKIYF